MMLMGFISFTDKLPLLKGPKIGNEVVGWERQKEKKNCESIRYAVVVNEGQCQKWDDQGDQASGSTYL